jgi:hypothetical protein
VKINLTPSGEGAAWEVDFTHGIASFDEEPPGWGGQEVHSIEFDGVVRTVKDFRAYVRSSVKTANVRHAEMMMRALQKVSALEKELNPQGDGEFLGDIDHDSPEGKDIRLRNQRREILRQRKVMEQLEAGTRNVMAINRELKIDLDYANEGKALVLTEANALKESFQELKRENELLRQALEDSRNHGRYVLSNAPQPLQDPTAKMTVFGVDYDVAYERVRAYEELERKKRIADYKADLAAQRDEERKKEITDLQEALRQKNAIIKSIREKVAEARIYE